MLTFSTGLIPAPSTDDAAAAAGWVEPRWLEEKRFTPDEEDILRGGYGETVSGVTINPRTALQLGITIACCKVICEDVGKLPLHALWDNGKTASKASTHALHKLINTRPCAWMTSQAWRETLTLHALLCGSGYAWKVMVDGELVELLPLVPGSVSPVQDTLRDDPQFDVYFADGRYIRVDHTALLRIDGLSWNGTCGLDFLHLAREAFGLGHAIQRANAKFYTNDRRPSGIITTEQKVSAEIVDRLRKEWADRFGPAGQGGLAILDAGFKFAAMSASSADSQTSEQTKLAIEDVCRIFRVYPQKVMHPTGTQAYAAAEAFNMSHLVDTMEPWLTRWEQALDRDVLVHAHPRGAPPPAYPGAETVMVARFNRDAIVRPSARDRATIYKDALGGGATPGWLSVNDILELEDRPTIGPEGDVRYVPTNVQTAGAAAAAAKPTPAPAGGPPSTPAPSPAKPQPEPPR